MSASRARCSPDWFIGRLRNCLAISLNSPALLPAASVPLSMVNSAAFSRIVKFMAGNRLLYSCSSRVQFFAHASKCTLISFTRPSVFSFLLWKCGFSVFRFKRKRFSFLRDSLRGRDVSFFFCLFALGFVEMREILWWECEGLLWAQTLTFLAFGLMKQTVCLELQQTYNYFRSWVKRKSERQTNAASWNY